MGNELIKYHCLSDDKMRELGFTEKDDCWEYVSALSDDGNVCAHMTISKNKQWGKVEVIDKSWGINYYYEIVLTHDPKNSYALRVKEKLDKFMFAMQQAGLIDGWKFS